MAARAIWKAVLNAGDLRVPVKLYSAVEDRSIRFRLLEARTRTPVKQHMVDPNSGKEAGEGQVRKGYEVEPGRFVLLEDSDLESLAPKDSRDIEIKAFVPEAVITPQWYDRPYYLGPDGDLTAYFALAKALEKKKREGFAQWVMRKKHYSGALIQAGGYLTLISLHHANEVLSSAELPQPAGRGPDPREIKMAEQLIAALEGDFSPEEFQDEYRERLGKYIAAKAKGHKPRLVSIEEKRPVKSLKNALAASLEAAKKGKGKRVA